MCNLPPHLQAFNFNLPDETLQLLYNYFVNKSEVDKAIIYGSRAMGTSRKASDIDVAIFTTVDDDISGRVFGELDQLTTPYRFDVTNYKTLSHQGLKDHIDIKGRVFFDRAMLD